MSQQDAKSSIIFDDFLLPVGKRIEELRKIRKLSRRRAINLVADYLYVQGIEDHPMCGWEDTQWARMEKGLIKGVTRSHLMCICGAFQLTIIERIKLLALAGLSPLNPGDLSDLEAWGLLVPIIFDNIGTTHIASLTARGLTSRLEDNMSISDSDVLEVIIQLCQLVLSNGKR